MSEEQRTEDWTNATTRYTGMNATPIDHELAVATAKAAREKVYEEFDNRYKTLDSGDRVQFPSGLVRDTAADKTEWALIVPKDHPGVPMIQRWAELMTRGAKKYAKRNWELADSEEEYERFRESAFRHFFQWYLGDTDEDHAAAVFFNIEGAEYTKALM